MKSSVAGHALRDTFATHILSVLIQEEIESALSDDLPGYPGSAVYSRITGNTLRKLQRLLGNNNLRYYIHSVSLKESRTPIEATSK